MDIRKEAVLKWLGALGYQPEGRLQVMAGDASFRRYFRLQTEAGSWVVMDAPPEKENCRPFVAIAAALRGLGLQAPEVIASDLEEGFLVLTDFGSQGYLSVLNASNASELYGVALDALARMQACPSVAGRELPLFTADFMQQELRLFQEWFLEKHLQLALSSEEVAMLEHCYMTLATAAASQAQVFMHRDFHAGNLQVLPDNQVGILDFQDAFIGPLTYDLVSLLRDCYIDWPDALVKQLVLSYKNRLPEYQAVTDAEFIRWFDLMGMQRHMKALLTYSRKYHRDHTAHYLQFVPRAMNYLRVVSAQYPEYAAFSTFINQKIYPALERVSISCAQ